LRTLIVLLAIMCCLGATAEVSGAMALVEPQQLTLFQPLPDETASQASQSGPVSSVAPLDLLQKGRDEYRGGNYSDAARDLRDAAQGFMSPAEMQHYIDTGHYKSLGDFETALIYLSLAYDKLGRAREAREPILRILAAERVEPHYVDLKLDADASDFEALANRVAPASPLPPNTSLAQLRGVTPQATVAAATHPPPPPVSPTAAPATTTDVAASTPPAAPTSASAVAPSSPASAAEATPPPVASASSSVSPSPASEPPARTTVEPASASNAPQSPDAPKPAVQPTVAEQSAAEQQRVEREAGQKIAAERAETERRTSERIAAERAASEKAASEKIVAERAASEKAAADRIAAERVASERAAAEKIAAARAEAERAAADRVVAERAATEKSANERIAVERAATEKAANEKIASARAAADRLAVERIASEKAAADRAVNERVAAAQAEARSNLYTTLRQAEAFATNGQIDSANGVYTRLLSSSEASRDTLAVVASGLYRIGAFARAVQAFQKLGMFNRGEEDLRYYYAVSLYETGHYADAQLELTCALPFIEINDSVARYRAKIEGSAAVQAAVR